MLYCYKYLVFKAYSHLITGYMRTFFQHVCCTLRNKRTRRVVRNFIAEYIYNDGRSKTVYWNLSTIQQISCSNSLMELFAEFSPERWKPTRGTRMGPGARGVQSCGNRTKRRKIMKYILLLN